MISRPEVFHPQPCPGDPSFVPWQTQGRDLKAARKTPLTQRKERALPPPLHCWVVLAWPLCHSHRSVHPQLVPPTETISARHFPKPLGKKVSAQLGETKGSGRARRLSRHPLGALPGCVPPCLGGSKRGTEMEAAQSRELGPPQHCITPR